MRVRKVLFEEETFHLRPRREERERGRVFQIEQPVKTLRRERSACAGTCSRPAGLEHREGCLIELARVSSNLAENAGLPPPAIAEVHREAGVAKIHHRCPYPTDRGEGLWMVREGSAL